MLSGKLLPAHPKPQPGEYWSSWFTRVAERNAVKRLALLRYVREKEGPPDRLLARRNRINTLRWLCKATSTPVHAGLTTTLNDYSNRIYPSQQVGDAGFWTLPFRWPGDKIFSDGIQFCPRCLFENPFPYFRRQWRLALFTFCPQHKAMLYDSCPVCKSRIAYSRHDRSREIEKCTKIHECAFCGTDLRKVSSRLPVSYGSDLFTFYRDVLTDIQSGEMKWYNLDFYKVVRQLCKAIICSRNQGKLRDHVNAFLRVTSQPVSPVPLPIERRDVSERYLTITQALWLMADPEKRIGEAWKKGVVLCNTLTKNFPDAPQWYSDFTDRLNCRKKRTLKCVHDCVQL